MSKQVIRMGNCYADSNIKYKVKQRQPITKAPRKRTILNLHPGRKRPQQPGQRPAKYLTLPVKRYVFFLFQVY